MAKQRNEIRILNPPKMVFDTVKKTAKQENRTMTRQAAYMLEQYIIEKGLNKP